MYIEARLLCHAMACFEQILHIQISGGDSVLRPSFWGDPIMDTIFFFFIHDPLFMTLQWIMILLGMSIVTS